MLRILLVTIPLLAIGVAGLLLPGAPRAYACTIDPDYNPVREAQAVVYGRIESFVHDPALPESAADPTILTVSVERTLKGDALPSPLEVHTTVPLPSTPLMCPQFNRERLAGRQAVLALSKTDGEAWSTYPLAVWFTDEPRESVMADWLARLLEGDERTYTPTARVVSSPAYCERPFVVSGAGWPSRTWVSIAIEGQRSVGAQTDDQGAFETPIPQLVLPCPDGGSFDLTLTAPAVPAVNAVTIPATLRPGAPLPPVVGSGAQAGGAASQRVLRLAGGGALLLALGLGALAVAHGRRSQGRGYFRL